MKKSFFLRVGLPDILLLIGVAALFLSLGPGSLSSVQATGNDDIESRLFALETRVSDLETENAVLAGRISILESPETITAKTIILQGATGSIYISADDVNGPRIKFIASENGASIDLGVIDLSGVDSVPSPNLIMNISDSDQSYCINLYATQNGPGLQYWGNEPPKSHALRPLAQFCPDYLVMMDSWLNPDELAVLTASIEPSSE